MIKEGRLRGAEFINVESEFAAMSVAIGASAVGARSYTATASQGLLFMAEAVYNAAGLGLPIVMTLANRAIGAPINIWNDHSDAMAVRDAGWIQLFAEDNQEACDMHIQAFALAEELSVPVMVCMDGFILTHAFEGVDIAEASTVDSFLGSRRPKSQLSWENPTSIGAMVGPEAFTEVRYLAHLRQMDALVRIPEVAKSFKQRFGRDSGGLISSYRMDDATTAVIAMGSMLGTIKDAVDARRDLGERVGVIAVKTFRPFPSDALAYALEHVHKIITIEKAFSVGLGGVLATDVTLAMHGALVDLRSVVAGLGGRPITQASLETVLAESAAGELAQLTFLDLDYAAIAKERNRVRDVDTSGGMRVAL
jgi:pyruvate ferredoxin oxidoreductase alpha subunit